MSDYEKFDAHDTSWAKHMIDRLRRMVARLRGRDLEPAYCEVRHLSTARVERVLAQVGAGECAAAETRPATRRYIVTDSHHPRSRYDMTSQIESPGDEPAAPAGEAPPAPAGPRMYPPDTELGQLEGTRDSLFGTADTLRRVADQMKRNVETQRRVNEKLAELRDRIREATERMKGNRVNIDLKRAHDEQHGGLADADSETGDASDDRPAGPFIGDKPVISLPNGHSMRYHEYVELTGLVEYEKFDKMGPIGDDDLRRLHDHEWWLTEE